MSVAATDNLDGTTPPALRFRPRADLIFRAAILSAVLAVAGISWAGWAVQMSPYVTGQDVVVQQPVAFSHEHHVGGLGIDCRYCHTSVAVGESAGLPATSVCMTCHSQIWNNAPLLQPVRDAWREDKPIEWQRVTAVPDYVYFNHSIHVSKGIGCVSCHGRVDQMPLMRQATSMTMSWCLECHRNTESRVQPRETVYDPTYERPSDPAFGKELRERYAHRDARALTDCVTCHR